MVSKHRQQFKSKSWLYPLLNDFFSRTVRDIRLHAFVMSLYIIQSKGGNAKSQIKIFNQWALIIITLHQLNYLFESSQTFIYDEQLQPFLSIQTYTFGYFIFKSQKVIPKPNTKTETSEPNQFNCTHLALTCLASIVKKLVLSTFNNQLTRNQIKCVHPFKPAQPV